MYEKSTLKGLEIICSLYSASLILGQILNRDKMPPINGKHNGQYGGGGNKFLQNNNFYDIIEYGYNKDYKKGRG